MNQGGKGKQFRIGYKRLLRPIAGAMLFQRDGSDPFGHARRNCIFIKTMTIL